MRQAAPEVDVGCMTLDELRDRHADITNRMNAACLKSVQLYGQVTPNYVLSTFTHAGSPCSFPCCRARAKRPWEHGAPAPQAQSRRVAPQRLARPTPPAPVRVQHAASQERARSVQVARRARAGPSCGLCADVRFWNACEACISA